MAQSSNFFTTFADGATYSKTSVASGYSVNDNNIRNGNLSVITTSSIGLSSYKFYFSYSTDGTNFYSIKTFTVSEGSAKTTSFRFGSDAQIKALRITAKNYQNSTICTFTFTRSSSMTILKGYYEIKATLTSGYNGQGYYALYSGLSMRLVDPIATLTDLKSFSNMSQFTFSTSGQNAGGRCPVYASFTKDGTTYYGARFFPTNSIFTPDAVCLAYIVSNPSWTYSINQAVRFVDLAGTYQIFLSNVS